MMQAKKLLFVILMCFHFSITLAQDDQPLEIITAENAGRIEQIAISGHGTFNSYSWQPDRKILALGSGTGVWLHDRDRQQMTPLDENAGYVRNLLWSQDGSQLAVSSILIDRCLLRIWEIAEDSGANLRREFAYCTNQMGWNPDGTRLAAQLRDRLVQPGINHDGAVYVLDIETGEIVTEVIHLPQTYFVGAEFLIWSPDGQYLLTGNVLALHIWNAATGDELFGIEEQEQFGRPEWSADGTRITAPCDKEREGFAPLCEWNAKTGEFIQFLSNDRPLIPIAQNSQDRPEIAARFSLIALSVEWSPDGGRLASIFDHGNSKTVNIWNTVNGNLSEKPVTTFSPTLVDEIQWIPHSREIVTYGQQEIDSSIRVEVERWNTEIGAKSETLFQGEGQLVEYRLIETPAIAYNSDATQSARAGEGNTIHFSSGQIYPIAIGDHNRIQRIQWSPNDQFIAVIYGNGEVYDIQVIDTQTLEIVTRVYGIYYRVPSLIWRPDSSMIAAPIAWDNSAGEAINVHLYRVPNERAYELTFYQGVSIPVDDFYFPGKYTPPGIAWSPNGDLIAVSSTTAINIYEPDAGKLIASIPAYEVISLSWHPDGNLLATSSNDGTIRLWAVHS